MGIWGYLRAWLYFFTGMVDSKTDALSLNPNVMRAEYDQIVKEKKTHIQEYMDAIAGLITQQSSKEDKLKEVTANVQRLEQLKSGALAKAHEIKNRHGDNVEKLRADSEYIHCQTAFKDFTSTLEEAKKRAEELETDLTAIADKVGKHKATIEADMRELEKLKDEKHDAVADVLSAQEEKRIADKLNGISKDQTTERLQRLREVRNKASANAKVSSELAGLDAERAENDFLQYATRSAADDEFEKLLGIGEKKESESAAGTTTKISES